MHREELDIYVLYLPLNLHLQIISAWRVIRKSHQTTNSIFFARDLLML
jgi:hypothetical protein